MQHVIVKAAQSDLNLFNMHGVWDLAGDSFSPQRQHMSKVICDAVSEETNVILLGDTNAKPTNQAMIRVEAHLVSVFGRDVVSTFNMRRKENPGYATAAVDMMFVSPNIDIIDKNIPDVDVSDHLPLIATVHL